MLKFQTHCHPIYVEIGMRSSHERTKTHIGMRFVSLSDKKRRCEVTHALTITNRRVVKGIPARGGLV